MPATDSISVSDELASFIFYSKYSRYDETKRRRETWEETVNRVQEMHLRKFDASLHEDIISAFDFVRDKKVLPSMRGMQFGGKAVEVNNARLFNCSVTHVHSLRSIAEVFWLLLSGCGVGVGLSERYLSRFPNLVQYETGMDFIHTVEDTIEGWADSILVLLKTFFEGNATSGLYVWFDYSQIRPKGSPLKTSGGQAPGHEGLQLCHEKVRQLLNGVKGQQRIKTIQVYDILMHIADAVLSGGVRRAAMSVDFEATDKDMMYAKTGNWLSENPQRARSNNSVLLSKRDTTPQQVKEIVECARSHGEPGFVFVDHPDTLLNPCREISFIPVTKEGKPGVQFCNLCSINGTKIKTEKEFYDAAKAAALIGTLQAAYTDFTYLGKESKELTEEEALLGVSILGVLSFPEILLNARIQSHAAQIVVNTNKEWAQKIGINQAARTTCIKPDGTGALVVGSMWSGIHPAHARRMFRRVQVNRQEPVYQHFRRTNPELCEKSVWSASNTDDIITFPISVPCGMIKSDLSAVELLGVIRRTQQNWVLPGTTEVNNKPLAHSVSCTVQVGEDEWEKVANYLYDNKEYFTAVSLISKTGDKDYPQAPMEAVATIEDFQKFKELQQAVKPVNYLELVENKDVTSHRNENACSGNVCEIVYV